MYGSKIGTEMEAVQLPEVRILLQELDVAETTPEYPVVPA